MNSCVAEPPGEAMRNTVWGRGDWGGRDREGERKNIKKNSWWKLLDEAGKKD